MVFALRRMRPRLRARISTHSNMFVMWISVYVHSVSGKGEPGPQKCIDTRRSQGKTGRDNFYSIVSPPSPILDWLKRTKYNLSFALSMLIHIIAGLTSTRKKEAGCAES